MMNELKGASGVLHMTVTVKRAATGKVETYELTGEATPEQAAALGARTHHGSSGALVGDGAKLTNEQR